jgi:hypothetical protein
MILTYYPDIDTVDVSFNTPHREGKITVSQVVGTARDMPGLQAAIVNTETLEADATGHIQTHMQEGRLAGLTIEHARKHAPAAWNIEELRREAAQIAASTNRIIESITHDVINDRRSIQTGQQGPHSTHTSDKAVRDFNELIDHYREKTTAA